MACITSPLIETVRRNATVTRRDVVRAQKAVKIAGPDLRPAFESRLLGLMKDCAKETRKLIEFLNSPALDSQDDKELSNLAGELAKVVVIYQIIIDGCGKLSFKRKVAFKSSLAELSSLTDRLASIREGLGLATRGEFISAVSSAVEQLRRKTAS